MPTVEVSQLTKRYGVVTAVDGVSLAVERGEIVALLGQNGAGKTTLMQMLSGLLSPDGGEVRILGQTGRALGAIQRSSVGYCPQALTLWQNLTCREQLRFVAALYGLRSARAADRTDTLLHQFGLFHKREALARGLSGGMQRRLSLALAFVHDPDVLILDEPSTGLDPQSRLLVRRVLRLVAQQSGKTVLVSTHDIDEADRLADRVAIMDHGAMLVVDRPMALKTTAGRANSVIEVELAAVTEREAETALSVIRDIAAEATRLDRTLVIPTDQAATLICPITSLLQRNAVPIREVRLRERSLEDVFVELTGRRLCD